jgi:RNA polymerase sigma factor (sigma-70 family)
MKKLSQWQKLLFETNYSILLKVAFRYVGTYEQAIEMTYQGFVKIFNEVAKLQVALNVKLSEGLSAWVKRIFIIALVDKINSEINLHMPRPIPGDIWQEPGTGTDAESERIYIELIKVLKGLPLTYRLVFNLHVIDGFSHAEIAKMLHITVENSKYNLMEARKIVLSKTKYYDKSADSLS